MLADIQVSSRFAKALGYSDEQRLLQCVDHSRLLHMGFLKPY